MFVRIKKYSLFQYQYIVTYVWDVTSMKQKDKFLENVFRSYENRAKKSLKYHELTEIV
jgi:hypothetical protein